MRRGITAAFAAALVTMSASTAAAQPSIGDSFAAGALLGTPIGAFSPMSAGPMKGKAAGSSAALRLARYKPTGGTDITNIGGSYMRQAGTNAVVGGTVGYGTCDGCDGNLMLGVDLTSPLWAQPSTAENSMAFSFNLQGSAGYSTVTGDADVSAMSAAVSLPLGMTMQQSNNGSIALFVTPGFGWGSLDVAGLSESGTRPFFGAGAAWTAPAGWALHLGMQKVIIEDGATNIGAGFNWKFGN